MKKILSVLLVAAMLMSFSVCAFAETNEFVATEEKPFFVELPESEEPIDYHSTVVDVSANGEATFDLNGSDIVISDPAVGSAGTEHLGMQLLDEVNSADGKVTITSTATDEEGNVETSTIKFENNDTDAGNDIYMGINNYTNLELVNVVIDASNLAKGTYAVSNNNNGSLTIGEGAGIIAAENGVAFDVYVYAGENGGMYQGGPSVTVEEGAGTIDGAIEFDGTANTPKDIAAEDQPSLDIKGGNFVNFVLKIGEAVREYVDNINISGGTFDTKNVVGTDAEGKAYTFEQFLVEDHVVVEQNGKFVVMTKAAYEASNKKDEVVAVIPAETYVPPVYEVAAGTGNATIEVDGKEVAVKLDSTVVSATAAPVALADAAPVVVKVNVAHTALSANVFTAIEMVETLSETLEVKGADGAVIEAEQYEVEFDGHGQIQIKLSAELMQKLGVGTHVLKINLGGYEIEVTVVIQ